MFRTFVSSSTGADFVDLSFRRTEDWLVPAELQKAGRTGDTPFDTTAVLLGDEDKGPVLLLLAVRPGVDPPDAPAHRHASDNWRMSLRGMLPMGSERYNAGEFRLQQGWMPYASDNYAHGPDGGWTVLLFGDRRGVRVRPVSRVAPSHEVADRMLADWLGISGDLVSSDPSDTSGPSAIATNLGVVKGAHLNGSFAGSESWPRVGEATRVAGALLGDPISGPLLVLAETAAGACAATPHVFDTEVFHLVAAGTCTIGGVEHSAGDMRVRPAGSLGDRIVAGPDGLQEVIVVGDRRGAPSTVEPDSGWPGMVR